MFLHPTLAATIAIPVTEDSDERRLVERVLARQAGGPGGPRGPDCLAGDDPFRDLVDRYGPVVVRVLRRFRISQEDRDDCWQTVFLRLFENDHARLRAWRGRNLPGYIAIITRRIAIDLLRTRNPEDPWPPGLDPESPGEPGGDTPDPCEGAIRQVARTCLTPRHFELYERYCRGENAEQIAQALKMTKNNVFVQKNRMIRALRECLKQRGL